MTPSVPLYPPAFFGSGWRNSGNSFHWPHQTFQSHGILFHRVLLLNKALHFQWGKRKRMRGRAQEWNSRKMRRTSAYFLTDIVKGGGVVSLTLCTSHWLGKRKRSKNTAVPGNLTSISPRKQQHKVSHCSSSSLSFLPLQRRSESLLLWSLLAQSAWKRDKQAKTKTASSAAWTPWERPTGQ